jgi:UDP-N-acetylmuramyl pentapeptide phosphotransferase/UDP-N-acetylglucosamine-1-phosphate transferase
MLGDTGSNSLGAILGLAGALYVPFVWQCVIVALLIVFHAWAEKHSLTKTIEENDLLRSVDRKIGVR